MLKYLVPNICATIPLVGGTVDNHNIPNVTPKKIDEYMDGGRNINIEIIIALKKYKRLSKIFLLYFVPK